MKGKKKDNINMSISIEPYFLLVINLATSGAKDFLSGIFPENLNMMSELCFSTKDFRVWGNFSL